MNEQFRTSDLSIAVSPHIGTRVSMQADAVKVRVRNVNAFYGEKQALKNVSMDIPARADLPLLTRAGDAWLHLEQAVAPARQYARLRRTGTLRRADLSLITPAALSEWLMGNTVAIVQEDSLVAKVGGNAHGTWRTKEEWPMHNCMHHARNCKPGAVAGDTASSTPAKLASPRPRLDNEGT